MGVGRQLEKQRDTLHARHVADGGETPDFFERPILNSPYRYPGQHWELDDDGQPTNDIIFERRRAAYVTPVPKPRKQRGKAIQPDLGIPDRDGHSTATQQYDPIPIINDIRSHVGEWRQLQNPRDWKVTPVTARLLEHWRHYRFSDKRPFFCQIEAAETIIWLTEVAPQLGPRGKRFWEHVRGANEGANPELLRLALKLATGAGKTTVMAMLIAWHTINEARQKGSGSFSRGFLIIVPGITIRDRLRVLQPSDPENYYRERELVPTDMLGEVRRAKIVITNYHSFKLRERMPLSRVSRSFLQGRGGPLQTLETEGQMIQRALGDLLGMKNLVVLNDEAHHCYREKPSSEEDELSGEEKEEAKKNTEAARLWLSGIEAVKRKLGVRATYDLSATPFFLRGSGYHEGTLFPWTVSDFSLMDAIECGIVKLPRVPVADNVPGGDTPKFRNLWDHIGKRMPKKGRGQEQLDPLRLPAELQSALDALYGHYTQTFAAWQEEDITVPPVFIIVCNNTSTSKLVYDYVSGFERQQKDGTAVLENGRLELFRNYDENGNRLGRPRTLLIDSEQLESGDALDQNFRNMATDEIERFRRDLVERSGDPQAGLNLSDEELLREVMNTVGRVDRLGESIRCVVSVSMLTEGWDANTVTHILGVRAFGTQLLCEQVVGRALRRQSYDLNDHGHFDVEYADVLGVPFDFTAKPVVTKVRKARETVRVEALRERDPLAISFPRVEGYHFELPETKLTAKFTSETSLTLTPDLVGPSVTKNQGIIGEGVDLTVAHLDQMRTNSIVYHLSKHLLYSKFRDAGEEPKLHLFGQLTYIVRQWIDAGQLICKGGTFRAQVVYLEVADLACERIKTAIAESAAGEKVVRVILDPYNPVGSTAHVNFTTSKKSRWKTDPRKSHVNWVVLDSDWEGEFCRIAETHSRVRSYVKNQALGLEVPYLLGTKRRRYIPDFIVQVDDGRQDPLNLIVEIKGFRGEDAREKANTMRAYWVPGVNNLGRFGRWDFLELHFQGLDVYDMEKKFNDYVEGLVHE